jgi:hypothetical protein
LLSDGEDCSGWFDIEGGVVVVSMMGLIELTGNIIKWCKTIDSTVTMVVLWDVIVVKRLNNLDTDCDRG